MIHILFKELVDHPEGILVWRGVEIEGATQEVVGGVRDKELPGSSGVSPDAEEDASYPIVGDEGRVFDGAGLIGVFEGELIGVIAQPVEFVCSYHLVADIDAGAEAGKVDVYPPRVLRDGIEIGAVFQDVGINRVFESIGEAGLVEGLVFVLREIDLKVGPPLGGIDGVAGKKEGENEN